ncbi:MAG TPA: hypothetical protein VEQ16_00585 [Acidocella sp.]|jgi:hypothetical protein|nr:hypothetical protein [Acidocella sp.]
MRFRPNLFLVWLLICCLVGLLLLRLIHLLFWAGFLLAAAGLLINSIVAARDEHWPGRFLTPSPPKKPDI